MRISLIVSLFERSWVLSLGTEYSKDETLIHDGVELQSNTEVRQAGFRPNEEWEGEDD